MPPNRDADTQAHRETQAEVDPEIEAEIQAEAEREIEAEAGREANADREVTAGQVWSTLEEQMRREVVSEFRRIVKEMIDEHFRFDSAQASATPSRDLHSAVEPLAGAHQPGEPANAVRAA